MQLGIELFGAALLASICGSMVGLGGGFILVPLLRLVFGLAPAEAAGTSLALVVANSGSGALTYLLQKRVNIRLGLLIAAGGLPGSILGAIAVQYISATAYDWIFAIFLICVAVDMVVNANKRAQNRIAEDRASRAKSMSYRVAIFGGFGVGFISSMFGIGGGVIAVPMLLYFSSLPAHSISATSHFAIFLTSPVGLAVHVSQHDIRLADVIPLVIGGLIGGPIGARLSLRLKSRQLLIIVAIALLIAAISLLAKHL